MSLEASSETEEMERWHRISMHVRTACSVVERVGTDVLIKFDGARDNDEIYTVVLDVGRETSYREDSSDLEEALSRFFGASLSGATSPADDFAEPLRSFDLLAKRGFVVGLIIMRVGTHLEFEVFLSRDDKTFEPMKRRGPVFGIVANEIIRYAGQSL